MSAVIKKGSTVSVISGAFSGAKGKVLDVNRRAGKVRVEGVALVTKHKKGGAQAGGMVKVEAMISISKVRLAE